MGDLAWVRCTICHDDHKVTLGSIELYQRPDGGRHYVANCPTCGPFAHGVGPENGAALARLGVVAKAVA
jgi:hypothetical protein